MQIGDVNISFLGHAGFLLEFNLKKIYIDPFKVSEGLPKADLILVTHTHFDHCSIADIEKVSKEGTTIVVPADAQSKINRVKNVSMQVVEVGDEIEVYGMKIKTLPAYNVGKEHHPKKEGWLGYVIKTDKFVIYHSGDTDNIHEMKNLTGYGKKGSNFIVLLPVSGEYVLDAEEAADVAHMLSPDLAIPMHYGSGVAGTIEDAQKFVELCKEKGINAEMLERI